VAVLTEGREWVYQGDGLDMEYTSKYREELEI
jgi:hypothetical protein